MTGTVKWFNNTHKYGFIVGDDGGQYFVHFTEIQMDGYKTLRAKDRVEFEVEETPKGPKAVRVLLVEDDDLKDARRAGGEAVRS